VGTASVQCSVWSCFSFLIS